MLADLKVLKIKAFEIVHNKSEKNIEYRDAFMEFLGIPVFYTPYFFHPDPTVKRRTGLLVPKYSSNNILGVRLETPYYIHVINESAQSFLLEDLQCDVQRGKKVV